MEPRKFATRAERRQARADAKNSLVTYDVNSLYPDQEVVIIDRTPNVGITNPDIRLWIGIVLFILSLVSGIAAMTIGVYPELEIGDAVVSRGVVLANQIISFLTGAFGLAFVSPNVPTKP